jgi:hypothetical protein
LENVWWAIGTLGASLIPGVLTLLKNRKTNVEQSRVVNEMVLDSLKEAREENTFLREKLRERNNHG